MYTLAACSRVLVPNPNRGVEGFVDEFCGPIAAVTS
jgi:hypothetical protein